MQAQPVQPVSARHPAECSSLEAQLLSLYGERQWLERELGCSSATALVARVRDLERSLSELRLPAHGAENGPPAEEGHPATPNPAMDQTSSLSSEPVAHDPAENPDPHPDETTLLAEHEQPAPSAGDPEHTPAALPAGRLDQVVRALGLLAAELAPRFGSSELLVEGEVEGVRFTLRCQSPEATP
jgi:hypothetical protein